MVCVTFAHLEGYQIRGICDIQRRSPTVLRRGGLDGLFEGLLSADFWLMCSPYIYTTSLEAANWALKLLKS